MIYSTLYAARRAAQQLANKRRESTAILSDGAGPFEVLSRSALEDSFAAGDLTWSEFMRDCVAEFTPRH